MISGNDLFSNTEMVCEGDGYAISFPERQFHLGLLKQVLFPVFLKMHQSSNPEMPRLKTAILLLSIMIVNG